ncbi:CRISPR-associated endoribonuclease Cas6 [Rhabdochromatium marinum]|uniref:CRISPR-associated endoribonuclease Cas6 n=1 Tax=Rhabdochromatium marinum TaxID=48729 RepID=UPI0019054CE6|nr:CRISPR-associated endoribonuclease Cas6 [Rhabdochromatium marinum]MBK1649040.1 CRISPR-associated protein Cas6 [Rhabdochromatium marinum]
MRRIRLKLARGRWASYRHLDLIHDAIVNALTSAGATSEQVIGARAHPWTFAALGHRREREGRVHSLVISTSSPELAVALKTLKTDTLRYARAATGELFDFSAASVIQEDPPLCADPGVLGVLALAPIVIRDRSAEGTRWHSSLADVDLSAAVNARLSRFAGREVALTIQPDSLYLRANPKHSVLVSTKRMKNGRSAFVIGMQAPLVLAGRQEDLLLAWYAGIGEKTRNGFGCIGLAENGVGR